MKSESDDVWAAIRGSHALVSRPRSGERYMEQVVEIKRRLSGVIAERLKRSPEVGPFPAIVTQLISACQDPHADSRRFESIIECDPALAGRVMWMANKPLFCASAQVRNIGHAVSVLGLRRLKSVAMCVAGEAMFSSGKRAQTQRRNLWNHSVGCAVVAQSIARYLPVVEKDEAFLAGIFHDIGKLLFYETIPEEYSALEASFSGRELIAEEERLLGATHEAVGLASADSWALPLELQAAIGWHHHPTKAQAFPRFAQVVALANRLAKRWGIGSVPLSAEQHDSDLEDELQLIEIDLPLSTIEDVSRSAFEETTDSD